MTKNYIISLLLLPFIICACHVKHNTSSCTEGDEALILCDLLAQNSSEWEQRVERSKMFLSILASYMDGRDHGNLSSVSDTLLCKCIYSYYSTSNPLDGGPGEVQSTTVYNLFYQNTNLCMLLDQYMSNNNISTAKQDTIWLRIAFDIMGTIMMNEDVEEISLQKGFRFIQENGYFVDDYCPFIK